MQSIGQFFKTTLLGGVLFLLPVVVLAFFIGKAFEMAHAVVDPLAQNLPFESIIGLRMPVVLAIVLILLACFAAGIVARGVRMKQVVDLLERKILTNIPGYDILKSTSENILGPENEAAHPVVLVRFDDGWQLGLKIDELENGLNVVFIPDTPSPWSGAVFYMTADRILPANVKLTAALRCLKGIGAGSRALLKDVRGGSWPSTPG